MSQKPYADDWKKISPNVEYSKTENLYWSNKTVYDELSANHNGIIGAGAHLRNIIKEANA